MILRSLRGHYTDQMARNIKRSCELSGSNLSQKRATKADISNFMKATGALQSIAESYVSKYGSVAAASSAFDSLKKICQIYNKYSLKDEIDIDGTLAYMADLGIEPEDVQGLILAYVLKSPSVGVFRRSDFLNLWIALQVDTIEGMRSCLNNLLLSLDTSAAPKRTNTVTPINFTDLYNFTFEFLKELPAHKLLDPALAVDYWNLLVPLAIDKIASKYQHNKSHIAAVHRRLQEWCTFITTEYKRPVSNDAWRMFYLFFRDVVCQDPIDFKSYSEMDAWPSVIDEFVEYLTDNDLLPEQSG